VGFGQVEDIRGDLWYGTPARYVRLHPAHSTTLTFPLEHLFDTIPHSSTSLASKSEPEVDPALDATFLYENPGLV
jgi:hypothetical protein